MSSEEFDTRVETPFVKELLRKAHVLLRDTFMEAFPEVERVKVAGVWVRGVDGNWRMVIQVGVETTPAPSQEGGQEEKSI